MYLKFGFEPGRVREIKDVPARSFRSTGQHLPPAKPSEAITGDPDDDLILACAVEAAVDILVSGDRRHLLPVREYRGIRIIAPQTLLAELAAS